MSNLNIVVLHDLSIAFIGSQVRAMGLSLFRVLTKVFFRMGSTVECFQSWRSVLGFIGYVGVHMSWTTLDTDLIFQTSSYNTTVFMFILCFFLDVRRHNAALTLSAVLHQLHQSKCSICSPLAWYRTILVYMNVHFCPQSSFHYSAMTSPYGSTLFQ